MKNSKLFKLLTITSAIGIVSIAPITLCQCGNNTKPTDPDKPSVDPSVSDKVTMETSTDSGGNSVNKLTPKASTDKITAIKVMIGSDTLTSDEYKVEGLSSNGSTVTVTIYKATLDKHSGSIVVTPTIESTPGPTPTPKTLKSISCSPTTKSVEVDSYLKSSSITVKANYSDSSTETLAWDVDYKIYEGSTEITNFSTTGYHFTSTGTKTFTIKYIKNTSFTATLKVTVTEKPSTSKVYFEGYNGSVSYTSKSVTTGATFGSVKPTATPEYGYKNNVVWKLGSSSGTTIDDSYVVQDGQKFYACFNELRPTGTGSTKTHTDEVGKPVSDVAAYIPHENASPSLWYVAYETDKKYTFTITLDEDITNIRYFWIHQRSKNALFTLRSKNNIVSVKHNDTSLVLDTDYKLIPWGSGNYIDFLSSITSGTITIEIAFHDDGTLEFIPVYEKL